MHKVHNSVNQNYAHGAFARIMRAAHYCGMNLATYRKAKGLSQEQLAELIGVNQSTIQRAETMHASAKLETYAKAAEALGVTLADLFSDDRSSEEALLVIAFRSSDQSRKQILSALAAEAESQDP